MVISNSWRTHKNVLQTRLRARSAGLKVSDQPAGSACFSHVLQCIFQPLQYFSLTKPAATVFFLLFQTSERGQYPFPTSSIDHNNWLETSRLQLAKAQPSGSLPGACFLFLPYFLTMPVDLSCRGGRRGR